MFLVPTAATAASDGGVLADLRLLLLLLLLLVLGSLGVAEEGSNAAKLDKEASPAAWSKKALLFKLPNPGKSSEIKLQNPSSSPGAVGTMLDDG